MKVLKFRNKIIAQKRKKTIKWGEKIKMKKAKFYTAVVTAFQEYGSLDKEGNRAIYERLISAGSDGIVLMGSTGEFCSLNMETARELTDLALQSINGRIDVIVGISRMIPEESVELGNYALSRGADAVILISPYYFKLSDADIEEYYDETVPRINGPVLLYNFPGCTAHDISPELALRLRRKYSNIRGFKDTITEFGHTRKLCTTILPEFPDFEIYSGFDEFFIHNVISGGAGCIGGLSNVCPELFTAWTEAVNNVNWQKAVEIQKSVNVLMELFDTAAPFLKGVKHALKIMGVLKDDWSRKPLLPVTSEEDIKIRRICNYITDIQKQTL